MKTHGYKRFKYGEIHFDLADWTFLIGMQISTLGLFIDILCFTIIIGKIK